MEEQARDINREYYQSFFQFPRRSEWMEKIWAEAFGDQYPAGLEHYGYVTRHDLDVFASHLNLPEGSLLLDVGCGKGGPGLKLAERQKLRLTGVDPIPEALDQARAFSANFELAYPAHFQEGEFYSLPFEAASFDAVISIDSFWTSADKLKGLTEVRRVMRPGAKFIFTHWDILQIEAIPTFEMSGLRMVSREETRNWKEYQRRVYDGIKAHQQELIMEMRESVNMLLYEANASPPFLDQSIRRIYVMELPHS